MCEGFACQIFIVYRRICSDKVGRLQALYGEMTGSTADFKGQILQVDVSIIFLHIDSVCVKFLLCYLH